MTNETKGITIGALRACQARSGIEETFTRFEISNIEEKMNLLQEAMYNPTMFFSTGEVSLSDKYESIVQLFLIGKWRLYTAYQQLGKIK
ncbi:MAG: hypothetical protein ACRC4W_02015 [Treponemataceae bacterium]